MASAWDKLVAGRPWVRVFRGSVTDLEVAAVVSPANSFGWMRGGIDGVYSRWLPGIEDRVRAAIAAEWGSELPVGETVLVPTGIEPPAPGWPPGRSCDAGATACCRTGGRSGMWPARSPCPALGPASAGSRRRPARAGWPKHSTNCSADAPPGARD